MEYQENIYSNYYDQSQQRRNPSRSGVNPQQRTPVGYQQTVSPAYEFPQRPQQGYQSIQQVGYQQSTYQPPIDNQLRRQPTNGFGYENIAPNVNNYGEGNYDYEQEYNEKYSKRR
ncbi:3846_t:CDS:1, partial [Cetraspora pellucida]